MTSRNLFLSACTAALLAVPAIAQTAPQGHVFAMSNATSGNEIVIFDRDAQGQLTLNTSVLTNGMGTGQSLESQGSLIISRSKEWLFAANAGSDDISVFKVSATGLTLTDTVASGGTKPISLTFDDGVLYVLNAGTPNSISGFTLDQQGLLTPIANSIMPLSAASVNPSQIAFSPNGGLLLVTEKDTNLVGRYTVNATTNAPLTFETEKSPERTPFGLAFRGVHHFFVADANSGQLDDGAVTPWGVRQDTLIQLKPSADTTETATCWIATMGALKFAYVSNTGSDSITGFGIKGNSKLSLLDPTGKSASTGSKPADLATVRGERFLYVLNSGDGTVSAYGVDKTTGALLSLHQAVAGLPTTGAAGLAAH
jgi:6-phosphogluconolactonase